jgi:NAD(P) transhydrogenase subunit alpha
MQVAVVKERYPSERRVALVPAEVNGLIRAGCTVLIEQDAGLAAGYDNDAYVAKEARIVDRQTALQADVLLGVRWAGADASPTGELPALRAGQVVIGMCDPLNEPHAVAQLAISGVQLFALELMPRITRAQSMDVLSSMATLAGYRAVLLAAIELPQMFPLLMTAAGTLAPARVLVIGAGVAGLQAIATARRLGAVVQAYDVRPAVREQCESLGAKFVELQLETAGAEGEGGYARKMDEAFYEQQRFQLARVVGDQDVVISTAAVPGQRAPLLITEAAVAGMRRGSVIVDLAAERGGNCPLSRADQRVEADGVVILGPTNLPAEMPRHASQMFAKNITSFLRHLITDGQIRFDPADEIIRATLLTRDGQVVQPRVRELLGLAPTAAS